MIRRVLAILILAAVTALPALAHEGHTHKIMGTILTMNNGQVEILATDGKKVTVTLNDKTRILKGEVKGVTADLKEGVRVVVEAEGKDSMVAKVVRVGAAPATKKS